MNKTTDIPGLSGYVVYPFSFLMDVNYTKYAKSKAYRLKGSLLYTFKVTRQ